MDDRETRNERDASSAAEVESNTRDDKHSDESKDFESMIPE